MGRPLVRVGAIAPGPGRPAWCADCQSTSRIELDIFALTVDGLIRLGTYTYCCACDTAARWRCSYCTHLFPADAPTIRDHLADAHGSPA